MTEDEARDWVRREFGSTVYERIDRFATLLLNEAVRQNLIARSTFAIVWNRHLADSAQLVLLVPSHARSWIDVGSGAGLPGVVVAAIFHGDVFLVEPRARRCEFLRHACAALSLKQTHVVHSIIEKAPLPRVDVISARAVAPITKLWGMTSPYRHEGTTLILPRGQSGRAEVEEAWQRHLALFHVEQSRTDPLSCIVVAREKQCSA